MGGFKFAHHLSGFKSLDVPDDGAARGASQAIYETILDVPALHFMLSPGGKWWGRAAAIGIFTLPIAMGVKTEILQRKTPRSQSPGPARPAPQPTEPGEPDDDARYALTGI